MADTIAVPLDHLARANYDTTGQPLCPACQGGRLHPYYVTFALRGFQGVDSLSGWVAVCVGNREYNLAMRGFENWRERDENYAEVDDMSPCGFSMPMMPHRTRPYG